MTFTQTPLISVIVATKDRQDAIIPCLDAIQDAMINSGYDNYEILVVNNNSADNTESLVTKWIENTKFETKLLHETKAGVSAARNCGIRNANGDIFVFIDDDCHPHKDYFTQVMDYYRQDVENDNLMVMRSGSVVLGDPTDLKLTIKPVHEKRSWQKPMSMQEEGQILGDALIGCNMIMSKSVVEQVGFFDEKLGAGAPTKAAEDTDYYYRAYIKNVKLEIVPDMEIAHFHGRKDPSVKVALLKNYAIGGGALIIKYLFIYPRFSRHFYWLTRDFFKLEVFGKSEIQEGQLSRKQRLGYHLTGIGLYIKLWSKEKLHLKR